MMKQQVIFVAGTSYSGSTMLDMILANDKKGHSLGEISALFRPFRKHHLVLRKQLLEDKKWGNIIRSGEKALSRNLFETFPEIEFFVDSSKDPFWISDQINNNRRREIVSKVVLIYKGLYELATSFHKRGVVSSWAQTYTNYYRKFFSLIKEYRTVAYKDVATQNFIEMRQLCEYLDLPFSEGKLRFWEKDHQTFFGNNRTRFHLSNLDIQGYSKAPAYSQSQKRQLVYDSAIPEIVKDQVHESKRRNAKIQTIEDILHGRTSLSEHEELLNSRNALYFNHFLKRTLHTVRSLWIESSMNL
jgi:hypothetical protein